MFNNSEGHSPQGGNIPLIQEIDAGIIGRKVETLTKSVHILGSTVEICQFPVHDNSHTAVIKAGFQTPNGRYEALGVAGASSQEGATPEILINRAYAQALTRAASCAALGQPSSQEMTLPMATGPRHEIEIAQVQQDREGRMEPRQYNHSPNKPASDKQRELIRKLCEEHDIPESQARDRAGIDATRELSSKDANELIHTLKLLKP